MKKVLSLLLCLGLVLGVAGCGKEERYTNKEVITILKNNNYTIGDDSIGGVEISTGEEEVGWFAGNYTSDGDTGSLYYFNSSINSGYYIVDSSMPNSKERTKLEKKYSDELKGHMEKELDELDLDEKYIIEIVKDYFK